MWNHLQRTASPSTPIVTLSEVKAQLRLTTNDDDALLNRLIAATTATIEGPSGIGVALLTQTYRLSLHSFPQRSIDLSLRPIQSITSVTYVHDGELQTIDPEDYRLDQGSSTLWPVAVWPFVPSSAGAVTVEFEAGYGDTPADVPADLRHAVLMLIDHWYRHTGQATTALHQIPMGVESILSRYRVSTLA